MDTFKANDIAIIFATVIGPILAVWASEWRQSRKAEKERKERIFNTLWATGSSTLDNNHVQALNHIDLAFPAVKYPAISEAWRLYQSQLNSERGSTEDSIARWSEKARDLLGNLIQEMAIDLQISLPKSMFIQPSYLPIAHASHHAIRHQINIALLSVLNGNQPILVQPKDQSLSHPNK